MEDKQEEVREPVVFAVHEVILTQALNALQKLPHGDVAGLIEQLKRCPQLKMKQPDGPAG